MDEIVPVADTGFGHEEDEEEIDDAEAIPSESDSGGKEAGCWGWRRQGGGGFARGGVRGGGVRLRRLGFRPGVFR